MLWSYKLVRLLMSDTYVQLNILQIRVGYHNGLYSGPPSYCKY